MANENHPTGFNGIRHRSGGQLRLGQPYTIPSGTAGAIGQGDPVVIVGNGTDIAKAGAAAQNAIGIFVGCVYRDLQNRVVHSRLWPAGAVTYGAKPAEALVLADENAVMVVQCDELQEADVGLLADFDAAVPDVPTQKSKVQLLVAAGAGATTGKALRIKRLARVKNPDDTDNAYGLYAKAEVTWASHGMAAAQGAGV